MTIRKTLPHCDECTGLVIQSFHAILKGSIYRCCSESCRRDLRVRISQTSKAVVVYEPQLEG